MDELLNQFSFGLILLDQFSGNGYLWSLKFCLFVNLAEFRAICDGTVNGLFDTYFNNSNIHLPN